jgi:hypothetical protein
MAGKADSLKEQILRDYRQLVAEREKAALRVTTREEIAQGERDRDAVQAASALTVESIVKGLADLQLTFDRAMDGLANTLLSEASRLELMRRAIEVQARHLEELEQIEVAANALDILVQEQGEQARAFEERSAQQRATFAQEVADQRQAWARAQEEHDKAAVEYAESLRKERDQAEADYEYELERKRKIEMDKYEEEKRTQEREIGEAETDKRKQWSERERVLAERAKELEGHRAKIAAFPQEREGATAEARDKAFAIASREAEVDAGLFRKEVEANVRVRELKIQALESTIDRQAAQIESLSAELNAALVRAQDLASKAVASASVDEMALARQAKGPGRA